MPVTRVSEETFKEIHAYVHKELGDEYDLDMLGCVLKDSEFSKRQCIAYLYTFESLEAAEQVVKDFFN